MAARGKTRTSSPAGKWRPLPGERRESQLSIGLPSRGRALAADHQLRALDRLRRGDTGSALAELDAAVRCSPKDAELLVQRALARLGHVDLAQAVADANQTIRIDAHEVWAYYQHRGGRSDEAVLAQAVSDLDRALALEPFNQAARLGRSLACQSLGDAGRAAADLDAVLRAEPRDAGGVWVSGLARLRFGDFDAALRDFDDAVNRGYRGAAVHLARGWVRQLRGDLGGALADFDDAVYLDPFHPAAYHARGLARQAHGSLDGARADYDDALRLNPFLACVYNSRAGLRLCEGDCLGARADCDEAVGQDLSNPYALANRARLRWTSPAEALADCEEALALDPRCAWAYCVRGGVLAHGRQPLSLRAAVADYREALRLEPRLGRAVQLEGLAGETSDPSAATLHLSLAGSRATLTVTAGPPVRRRLAEFACTTSLIVVAAGLGILAGVLYPRLAPGSVAVSRWPTWLLAWALFGGLGAACAGVLGMRALVEYLGGYGAGRNPGRAALRLAPEVRALFGLPLTALGRLFGRQRRRWGRSLLGRPAVWAWSDRPSRREERDRSGRPLMILSLQAALRVALKAGLGGLAGTGMGLLVWAYGRTTVPGIVVGGFLGMLAAFTLVERAPLQPGGKRFAFILTGLLAGVAMSAGAGALLPGLAAGALAGHHVAEILRTNGTLRDRDGLSVYVVLAVLLGGWAGAVDIETAYRAVGGAIAGALYWGPAGALTGGMMAFVIGWCSPARIAGGPLAVRVFGGAHAAAVRAPRLASACFAALAGLLVGGSVGILGGALSALAQGALARVVMGWPGWIMGGALAGAALGQALAARVRGCRPLLAEDERLELVLPLPFLGRAAVILGSAAVGAGAGALIGIGGQSAAGPGYWLLVGTGVGIVTAVRLWAIVVGRPPPGDCGR